MRVLKKLDLSNPKSIIFAIVDTINYNIDSKMLKDKNVQELADAIYGETRGKYGDKFTVRQLEIILNKSFNSTTMETTIKQKPTLTDKDRKVAKESKSFNAAVTELQHLWGHMSLLKELFPDKKPQRIANAVKIAKTKHVVAVAKSTVTQVTPKTEAKKTKTTAN